MLSLHIKSDLGSWVYGIILSMVEEDINNTEIKYNNKEQLLPKKTQKTGFIF